MKSQVDYNLISSSYNKRYVASPMHGIQNALSKLRKFYNPTSILEVGCGTCKWLNEFKSARTKIFGLDYSFGMLKEAQNNFSMNTLIRADANHLPIKDNQFDLIYCVNAIHHFDDDALFINDAIKILKQKGVFCIIGLEHHDEKMDWYIYKYFDGIYELDKNRFSSFNSLSKWMSQSGLTNISTEVIDIVNTTKIGNDVFDDPFLFKDQSSQLALLSDDEYLRGISKMKKNIAKNPKIEFRVQFAVKMIYGIKTASSII